MESTHLCNGSPVAVDQRRLRRSAHGAQSHRILPLNRNSRGRQIGSTSISSSQSAESLGGHALNSMARSQRICDLALGCSWRNGAEPEVNSTLRGWEECRFDRSLLPAAVAAALPEASRPGAKGLDERELSVEEFHVARERSCLWRAAVCVSPPWHVCGGLVLWSVEQILVGTKMGP